MNRLMLFSQKTRKDSATYKNNPSLLYPSYGLSNASIPGLNLGAAALALTDATICNMWNFKDREDNGLLRSQYAHTPRPFPVHTDPLYLLVVGLSTTFQTLGLYSSSQTSPVPLLTNMLHPSLVRSRWARPLTLTIRMSVSRWPCGTATHTSVSRPMSVLWTCRWRMVYIFTCVALLYPAYAMSSLTTRSRMI